MCCVKVKVKAWLGNSQRAASVFEFCTCTPLFPTKFLSYLSIKKANFLFSKTNIPEKQPVFDEVAKYSPLLLLPSPAFDMKITMCDCSAALLQFRLGRVALLRVIQRPITRRRQQVPQIMHAGCV
jgi:hypothetical protein